MNEREMTEALEARLEERVKVVERDQMRMEGRLERLEENIEMSIMKMGERTGDVEKALVKLHVDLSWIMWVAAALYGAGQILLGLWLKA